MADIWEKAGNLNSGLSYLVTTVWKIILIDKYSWKLQEEEEEAFELGVRNLELKSQVESLESQVKKFKTVIFQMIKEQKGSTIPAPAKFPKVSQVQTSLNKIGQVQTSLNKSGRVQTIFNKMKQDHGKFLNPKTLAASVSYHDPTDLSFLDDVTV